MSLEQIELWHYLVVGAFAFFILEVFTAGFFAGSVGVGFLFSAVVAFFGGSYEWQIAFFAFGVALSFFTIKPIMKKVMHKDSNVKTNCDALVGQKAKVIEEINPLAGTGRVKVDGDDWKAKSLDDSVIELGTLVEITKLESIVVIVKKI